MGRPVLGRGGGNTVFEVALEGGYIGESGLSSYLIDRQLCLDQQLFGPLYADGGQVLYRAYAKLVLKLLAEIVW